MDSLKHRPWIVVAALLALAALHTHPVMASPASTNDDPPIIPDYNPIDPDGLAPEEIRAAAAARESASTPAPSDDSASAAEPAVADDTEAETESGDDMDSSEESE
jgi:hypothetical protein